MFFVSWSTEILCNAGRILEVKKIDWATLHIKVPKTKPPGPQFSCHDDVIKWNHFPRYWPFVRGIHRSPVNSLLKGQWRGALMFSLICAWINGWVNNREAGDLRHPGAHYDVTVMYFSHQSPRITSTSTRCFYIPLGRWLMSLKTRLKHQKHTACRVDGEGGFLPTVATLFYLPSNL